MSHQIGLPNAVTPEEVAREQSLGGAIDLCAKVAGYAIKQLQDECHFDKGQFSRWVDGIEGIKWEKLVCLMDACGNDAPLMWMLHNRGYEIAGLRKRESVTERELRLAREEIARLKAEHLVTVRIMGAVMTGRETA